MFLAQSLLNISAPPIHKCVKAFYANRHRRVKKPADDGKKAQPAHPVRHTIVNPSCFTHRKKNAVWK